MDNDYVDICTVEKTIEEDEEIIDVVTVDRNPPEAVRPLVKFEGFVCKICNKIMRDKAGLTRYFLTNVDI